MDVCLFITKIMAPKYFQIFVKWAKLLIIWSFLNTCNGQEDDLSQVYSKKDPSSEVRTSYSLPLEVSKPVSQADSRFYIYNRNRVLGGPAFRKPPIRIRTSLIKSPSFSAIRTLNQGTPEDDASVAIPQFGKEYENSPPNDDTHYHQNQEPESYAYPHYLSSPKLAPKISPHGLNSQTDFSDTHGHSLRKDFNNAAPE